MADPQPEAVTEPAEWDSGVGGVQCETCGRTTIVRGMADTDDPMDGLSEWICRPCFMGEWDEDDQDYNEPVDPCVYCPHENADHRGDGCIYCSCVAAQ